MHSLLAFFDVVSVLWCVYANFGMCKQGSALSLEQLVDLRKKYDDVSTRQGPHLWPQVHAHTHTHTHTTRNRPRAHARPEPQAVVHAIPKQPVNCVDAHTPILTLLPLPPFGLQMVTLTVRQRASLQDLTSRLRDKEDELEALRQEAATLREQALLASTGQTGAGATDLRRRRGQVQQHGPLARACSHMACLHKTRSHTHSATHTWLARALCL